MGFVSIAPFFQSEGDLGDLVQFPIPFKLTSQILGILFNRTYAKPPKLAGG